MGLQLAEVMSVLNQDEPIDPVDLATYMAALDGTDPHDSELIVRVSRFVVDSPKKADWAGRKLVEALASIDETKDLVNEQIRRLEEFRDARVRSLQHSVDFFTDHLVTYANAERVAGRKTVALPSVKVSGLAVKPKVDVVDEEAAVKWAEEAAPEAVKKSFLKSKAGIEIVEGADSRVAMKDGEIVPGVTVTEPAMSRTVRRIDTVSVSSDGEESTSVEWVSYTVKPTAPPVIERHLRAVE